MSNTTFDPSKNYKKVCYRADRDLLNTELNESQDIESNERRLLLDKIFAQGTIISGLEGIVNSSDVTISDGIVYLDGCAVNVPGGTISFPAPGEYLIYLDVFRREITASDDPSLVNPITGEPTAEREKWIATLQTRDTTNDPMPDEAISRTVIPVYIFNRDTGELLPYVGSSVVGGDIISAFSNHAGHGGIDRHPAVTSEIAGFMTPDNLDILKTIQATLPTKADDEDLVNLSNALNGHRSSSDHDGRYYTESEIETNFAPIDHVGAGGDTHSAVTTSRAGFMDSVDKIQLEDHETRIDVIETALPRKADDTDITALADALDTHKSSSDHDGRYYTESETDDNFAPLSHVGSSGTEMHPAATISTAGFMSASDKDKLDALERDHLPGYIVSMLYGENLDYSSENGWIADWNTSTHEKADIGVIYSPRGGLFYAGGYSSAVTFRFKQKFRLAAIDTLTFRVMARDDSVRIYLMKVSDNTILSLGGLQGDSEIPGSITAIDLTPGDYWLHVYLNNTGGSEINIILRDWYNSNVTYLSAL